MVNGVILEDGVDKCWLLLVDGIGGRRSDGGR